MLTEIIGDKLFTMLYCGYVQKSGNKPDPIKASRDRSNGFWFPEASPEVACVTQHNSFIG
ncbi:hypothetical protein AHAS_Ahas14G0129500 [Arachis hypogaea]